MICEVYYTAKNFVGFFCELFSILWFVFYFFNLICIYRKNLERYTSTVTAYSGEGRRKRERHRQVDGYEGWVGGKDDIHIHRVFYLVFSVEHVN